MIFRCYFKGLFVGVFTAVFTATKSLVKSVGPDEVLTGTVFKWAIKELLAKGETLESLLVKLKVSVFILLSVESACSYFISMAFEYAFLFYHFSLLSLLSDFFFISILHH